jgi:hypothetical protein
LIAADCKSIRQVGGKWYDIRRNGQTKTWKRDPGKVEIPCKVGFRECFRFEASVNVEQSL